MGRKQNLCWIKPSGTLRVSGHMTIITISPIAVGYENVVWLTTTVSIYSEYRYAKSQQVGTNAFCVSHPHLYPNVLDLMFIFSRLV